MRPIGRKTNVFKHCPPRQRGRRNLEPGDAPLPFLRRLRHWVGDEKRRTGRPQDVREAHRLGVAERPVEL